MSTPVNKNKKHKFSDSPDNLQIKSLDNWIIPRKTASPPKADQGLLGISTENRFDSLRLDEELVNMAATGEAPPKWAQEMMKSMNVNFNSIKAEFASVKGEVQSIREEVKTCAKQVEVEEHREHIRGVRKDLEFLRRQSIKKNAWFWAFPAEVYPIDVKTPDEEKVEIVIRFYEEVLKMPKAISDKIMIDSVMVFKNTDDTTDVLVEFLTRRSKFAVVPYLKNFKSFNADREIKCSFAPDKTPQQRQEWKEQNQAERATMEMDDGGSEFGSQRVVSRRGGRGRGRDRGRGRGRRPGHVRGHY